MANPLFSLITVTLNPGEGLARTVDSVRAQRWRDFEHIIKDAGSTDGSVQQYGRPERGYALMVICQPDTGIYDAMNQALAVARGKYVLFLNAGDTLYAPDVLAQLEPFCAPADSEDLVYTDYAIGGGKARVRSPSRLSRFFLYRTMLCHQVCFVRRDCYHDLGHFNTQLRIDADYDFLLRLMLRPQARSQYLPMVATTFLGGGISSDPVMNSVKESEVKGLRRKYFPGWEGHAFGLIYACTLPWLRNGIVQSAKLRYLATLYRYGVNLFYIICSWRKRGRVADSRPTSGVNRAVECDGRTPRATHKR